MERPPHILNAASNLLGISFILIAGLNVSNRAGKTFADEVAWIAATAFAASCLLSYLALRKGGQRTTDWADRAFLVGLLTLFCAIVLLVTSSF